MVVHILLFNSPVLHAFARNVTRSAGPRILGGGQPVLPEVGWCRHTGCRKCLGLLPSSVSVHTGAPVPTHGDQLIQRRLN